MKLVADKMSQQHPFDTAIELACVAASLAGASLHRDRAVWLFDRRRRLLGGDCGGRAVQFGICTTTSSAKC